MPRCRSAPGREVVPLEEQGDTTMLFVQVGQGRVVPDGDGSRLNGAARPDRAGAAPSEAGVLRLTVLDLARQSTTVLAYAPTAGERVEVVRRFGQVFFGELWGVHAQQVLSSSPV